MTSVEGPATAVDGCWNFRDALAVAARSGLPVRTGRLYRSDDATRLSAVGRATVEALGLAVVIDLRQDAQHQRPQRFHGPDRTVHVPLVDRVIDVDDPPRIEDPSDLADLYDGMLDRSLDRLGVVLDTVAAHLTTGPVLFHCAYGKDRAGLVAAVVQAAIGIPRDVIAADYGRSDLPAQARRASLVAEPLPDDPPMPYAPPVLFTAPAEAMTILLGRLAERHGSLDTFVSTIPTDDGTIERLRHALLL